MNDRELLILKNSLRDLSTNIKRQRLAHYLHVSFLYSFQSEQKSDAPKDSDATAAAPAPQVTSLYFLPSFRSRRNSNLLQFLCTYTCDVMCDKVDVKIYFCTLFFSYVFCTHVLVLLPQEITIRIFLRHTQFLSVFAKRYTNALFF